MATWDQIIEDPAFQELPTSGQAYVRQQWFDSTVLPELKATGIDEANLNALRTKHITEYDNGQGYVSSFASAAGRGAASTFTSAVQGVGALTGIESIEQAARDMDTAVTENLTVNPTMEKTNFAGNVLGNVAGFLVPGTLGMRVGKAAGMGAQLGGQIASNATILASGAGGGAQTADQYGVQGPERTGMVLGNMATELLSERIPFGLGSELKAMGRLAGLGEDAAKRTGGFFSDVGQNAVEEMAANTGSNLVTSAFVPEGVQTPGIFEGNLEAAAGGAIGGAFFGGINLMAPAAPKPSEVIVEGATQRAMAGNDAEAAAEIPGAKLQPTAAPDVPGPPAFDPTVPNLLEPAAGELPPPAGFAETTPPEAFPANLPEGLPAAAAVPGAVPEAFPATPAPAEVIPAEEIPLELYNAPQETTPTLAPIEADAASSEEMSVYFNDLKSALASSEDEDIMRGLREAATEMKQSGATWETTGIQERMALGAVYAEAVNRNLEIPRSEALEFYSGVGAASQAQQPGDIPFAAQTPPVPAVPGELPMEGAIPAAPDMMQPAPPAAAAPPITPAVASQGATPSDLIDQTGRLTVEGAQSMIEAIQSLGLTTAPFVINNTGVAPGVIAPPAAGSTTPVDGKPTIFLNQRRMTLDTPLHETTHLLTPTLLAEQPDLYAAGAALLANSPLRQAIVDRYVTEAGMTMTDEQITEEAMVTGLANNGAEWLKAYAGNAKMTRAIKEFLAKVREWFDNLMYSKGFDPNMSLEQFYKKVNRQMLAGKLQQRATNAPVQAMSLADIEKLKSPTGIPLAAFASKYAKDIKPSDNTLADADRIASEKMNEVNENPGSLLPTATAQGVREYHTRILIQPDGKTYDPNNLDHADATPEVLTIYQMRQGGSAAAMEQQEADRVNQIRQDDLRKLTNYLKGNTDYSPSEAMVMVLAASKYGVRSKKTDDVVTFTAVEITDKNQVMVPVVDGTMVPRLRDKMSTGMSMKKALEAAYTDAMDAQVQANRDNKYEGLVKFNQSQKYEDAVALNKACAGTPWCTGASTTTAETHIKGGDFYVYFEGGIAQVAFRMDGSNKLAEPPRGNYENQALNERQAEIAEKVLRGGEIPGGQGFLSDRDFINKVKNDIAGMSDDEVFMGMFAKRKVANGYGYESDQFPKSIKTALGDQFELRELWDKGYYTGREGYPSTAVAVYGMSEEYGLFPNLRLVANDIANSDPSLLLPALTTVGGSVSGNSGNLNFPALTAVGKNLSNSKGDLNFPMLTSVGGEIYGNEGSINTPALTTVGGEIYGNEAGISMPALTTVGGGVSSNGGNLDMPVLTTVGGDVSRNSGDLNMPVLTTVGKAVSDNMGSINMPLLTTVGGRVSNNTGSINMPALTTVGENVRRNAGDLNMPALTTVGGEVSDNKGDLDMPALSTVGGNVSDNIGSINMPVLTTVGGNVSGNENDLNMPALTTVGASVYGNEGDVNMPLLSTVGGGVTDNRGGINMPLLATVGEGMSRNTGDLNFPMLTSVGGEIYGNEGSINTPALTTVGREIYGNTGDLNMPLLESGPVVTGKYAKQTGASQAPDTRFSLAPATAQDKAYVAAVESGDVAAQQAIVDATAKAAGYNVGPVWHASDSKFDVFDLSKSKDKYPEFWFTGNKSYASNHGKYVRRFYLSDPYYRGEPEVFTSDRPERIKSADPVTYDDNGKIILPSQRFNAASPDIRFSLAPAAKGGKTDLSQALDNGDYTLAQSLVDSGMQMDRSTFAESITPSATQRATTIHSRLETQGIISKQEFSNGKGLVYGDGKGEASRQLGAESYEPYPPVGFTPDYTGDRASGQGSQFPKKYKAVLNTFVLNVVDPQTREWIVKDIANSLTDGGRGVIVTRGTDVANSQALVSFGPLERIQKSGGKLTYQKGFTQRELIQYLKDTLGKNFTVTALPGGSASDVRAQIVKNTDAEIPNPTFPSTRFSLAPATPTQQSARHRALEAKHDAGTITPAETAEAQALVDEVAKAAGFTIGPVHHGTQSVKRFNEFIGMWNYRFGAEKGTTYFTNDEDIASGYGVRVIHAYLRFNNPLEKNANGNHWTVTSPSALVQARKDGNDSVIIRNVLDTPAGKTDRPVDVFITLSPSQIKSADPFTGVPLDQRFNTASPDIRFSLAPAVTKPSNVARNQAGTRVRVLMENQTYEGQTMDDARDQALSLYDDNVDKGFTVAQHMAFIQDLRTNAGRKYQDMTYGAYGGMYVRDLLDESTNPERDPVAQDLAKRESKRVGALMAAEAANAGRQAKAFDLYDRIANSPEMTVMQHEQLVPFDGKQGVKDKFDEAATTAREAMEGLANEAINTAPEDAMTSAINQQVAAVAKGEETSNVGEVVLDEVKPAETEEDLPEWFRKGQELLGAELSGKIDDLTELLQVYAYLRRKDGTYSLTPEERSANVAARIKKIEESGKTLEQSLAETKKSIDEILSAFNKPKAKTKPKAAPIPKEAPPEGEIQDIVAARINRLLDKIVKPSTSPAKTRTDKEVLVDAIVSTMMAKAGLPADLKAGGDNVTLAFGLVVANPQLAAQSVQAVYDLLQSDPASANITSSDKIRGFMQMMTGQSFADGKAYGEKQLNTVLKNELKRLKISVNDVAMDAALTGKTVEQLEAALRDPDRELSKVLSADALNKVVAAVTGEFRKTAAQRAAYLQQEEANAKVRRDMTADRKKAVQFAKKQVSDAKAAADRAKKAVLDAMAKWKKSEDKKVKKASESVRKAMAEELRILRKTALDTMAAYKKAQDKLAMEAQRETRAAMAAEQRAIRKDREYRLALNRKARKAMRRKLAKRGGFMIPLDQTEAEELLDQKPKTVLQYLAREYGFSLTDIIGMARDQDRQATLEAKVGKLAEALGLTKEQADKFMGPVIAEGMKHISEARKKDVSQRINRVLTPVIGKKKTQKTEAEKLIKLAEMGGLTADNVEKLLLNSKNAKEFTPEFRQELIDLIAQANDPHLTQISRDLLTGKFLDKIKAARGITVLGLLGEWTMSNIFMSILSTFKVNFVWGFIKAASDSGIFITISGPAAARADAIAKGVTPAPRLAVSKVLFRQWLRGYAVNMQHNAAFMWSEGRGKDESDFTSQFANTGMELLSRIKDAQIQWSNDGKVLPQSAQKVIKAMAAFGKYTRRTMVASDFINRTSAFEMSKVLEAVKVMQAKGGAASTATIQREIDDALYGGSFKDAFAKANKQADDEIAAKKLGKPERGIRVGEIMDEMLGKNLGLTEKQTQEYLQDSRENAKRWSLANQTEGIFGEISNLMLAATRKFPGLKFALPAVRMPIAAFSQTLDWTPYGFLRLYAIDKNNNETESFINYLVNSKGEYGNWNKPVGGVPAYRKTDLMAKATIGSLIMVGLFIKAALSFDEDEDEADFYITGLGPSDPAENKAWREKGNAPFTFRFNGGTGFRFQESPFYGMLAPIAAWSDAHRYGKPGEAESDRIAYAIGKTVSGFQEAVVMKNLSDILAGGSSYSADGQLRNWSKATSRLASNVLMPRLGGEINTILYGPQDQKALGWGGRALANVPFVPSFNNKPAQDFLGREIHTKREGMLGEIYPALAHRVLAPSLDDPILNFVAKMSPNFLATTRRFKDGTRVMDNYEFVRKWNAAAGVKIREYLTPERMASYERKLAKDKPDAQTEFNTEINKIRTAALRKFSEVQF